MARPGVVFLRRRPVGAPDFAEIARQRALVPVIVTALIAVPYLLAAQFAPAPDASMIAQGTAIVEADPWPARFPLIGLAGWALWTAVELAGRSSERARRLVRLDEDELECWPGGRRRHIALADLVGARSDAQGTVLYVRPPGAAQLEQVRLNLSASAPLEHAVPDGDAWLVARLRELVAQRRRKGRPCAVCPPRAITASTDRSVSLAGDHQNVVVSAGPQHATVPAAQVASLRREADKLIVRLAPSHPDGQLSIELGESAADEEIVEWFQCAAARFDHGS